MAAATKTVTIRFAGETSGLTRASAQGEKAVRGFGSSVTRVVGGVAASLGALAAGAAIADFVKEGVQSLARIEQINQQTETAIKSTGGAAKVTAQHIEDLAGNLENLTATEAETTQQGANLLLTFTNIKNGVGKGNDIFDQTVKVMTDMSRALGQDTKSSAIQLGKALNDPIKGVTALQRVGVSFTAQQKDQIKALVESGRTMDAQKLILKELNTEFGGSAKAFAQTTQGRVELAKHAFGTLQETITAGLLPVVGKLANLFLSKGVPAVERLIGVFQRQAIPRLKQFGAFIRTEVLPRLGDLAKHLRDLLAPAVARVGQFIGNYLLPALKSIGEFIVKKVIPAISTVVVWLTKHKDVALALGIGILATVVPAFIAWAISAGSAAVATIAATLPILAIIAAVGLLALGVIELVKHWDFIWGHIWSFMKSIGAWFAGPFVGFFTGAWNKIKNLALSVFNWFKSNWPLLLAILTGPIGIAVLLITKHWASIKAGASAAYNWIRGKFDALVGFVRGLPGRIGSAARGMFDGIKNAFRAALNWIIDKWNNLSFTLPSIDTHIPGIGKIGGFTLSTPNIPRFHTGGVVPGPPTRETLILARGQERILTPDQSAGITIQNLNVRAYSDERGFSLRQVQNELAMHGAH